MMLAPSSRRSRLRSCHSVPGPGVKIELPMRAQRHCVLTADLEIAISCSVQQKNFFADQARSAAGDVLPCSRLHETQGLTLDLSDLSFGCDRNQHDHEAYDMGVRPCGVRDNAQAEPAPCDQGRDRCASRLASSADSGDVNDPAQHAVAPSGRSKNDQNACVALVLVNDLPDHTSKDT